MNIPKIQIFGRIAVSSGTSVADHFPTVKCAELLAFLTVGQGRALHRDAICRALWPDDPVTSSSRNRLSVTTYLLRKECQAQGAPIDDFLDADRSTMTLSPELSSDYREYCEQAKGLHVSPDEHCQAVFAKQIIELYRGSLAEGVRAPWVTALRAEAKQTFRDAVKVLARLQGPEEAKETIHQAAIIDLESEGAVPTYLQCMADQGQWETVDEVLNRLDSSKSARARRMAAAFRQAQGASTPPSDHISHVLVACVTDDKGLESVARVAADHILWKGDGYVLFSDLLHAYEAAQRVLMDAPEAKVSLHIVSMDLNSPLPGSVWHRHSEAIPGRLWMSAPVQELINDTLNDTVHLS